MSSVIEKEIPQSGDRIKSILPHKPEGSGEHLPPDEYRRYREVMRDERHFPITSDRVRELDMVYGYGNPGKIIYRHYPVVDIVPEEIPVDFDFSSRVREALSEYVLVSEKGYHMAVYGPMGDLFAREGRKLAHKAMTALGKTNGRKNPETLELFTGLGSLTASLHQGGHNVIWTVDRNTEIMLMTRHNWNTLGLSENIRWLPLEAMRFVRELSDLGYDLDVVYADPEWKTKLHERSPKPFSFDMMSANGAEVVEASLKIAPVVGIKSRMDMDFGEVERLARSLNAKAHIVVGALPISENRTLEEPMIFFLREDVVDYFQNVDGYSQDVVETVRFDLPPPVASS
ncbi:RsmD family RNA methyltransferase [Patescibacteria group bacterium]|nr:RsmD family RNA methyltransferase [Patescibacteria group bacterium]